MLQRLSGLPLLWRVFATNAVVLLLAFLGLVFAPVTVSVPAAATELVVLVIGLVALLAINLVLLQTVFRPLDQLADTMRTHDPLAPGARAHVGGDPDIAALALAFNDMLDRLESERRDSGRRALLVQEGERRRIARELHDEVGQTLTGVMLQVETLSARIPDGLRDQLDELRETARSGAEDVRRIAQRLRPEALEDLGLESAIAALATGVGEHAGLRVVRLVDPLGMRLPHDQELVVYRVAQEALTNVARHARASEVDVLLRRRDDRVTLTVRDDGIGLPDGALPSAGGIRGMRERAMLIGADLAITRAGGHGTQVTLSIDLDSP